MKDHRPHLKIPNATWDHTTKDDCRLETDLKSTSQVYCRHSADALPVENDILRTYPQLRPHCVPRSLMSDDVVYNYKMVLHERKLKKEEQISVLFCV